jgi:hypothetical protein
VSSQNRGVRDWAALIVESMRSIGIDDGILETPIPPDLGRRVIETRHRGVKAPEIVPLEVDPRYEYRVISFVRPFRVVNPEGRLLLLRCAIQQSSSAICGQPQGPVLRGGGDEVGR